MRNEQQAALASPEGPVLPKRSRRRLNLRRLGVFLIAAASAAALAAASLPEDADWWQWALVGAGALATGLLTLPLTHETVPDPLAPAILHRPERPAISNLRARNPHFSGRRSQLDVLRRSLDDGGAAALVDARPLALHGLGGVGKTQLALEYAHRWSQHYDLRWWVSCEPRTAIAAGVAQLAGPLGIPERADQEELVGLVLDELRRRDRWLLVFDNADEPAHLEPYLPGAGHVLITSRNPSWSGIAEPVEVDRLPMAEAIAFLAVRVPGISVPLARELAEELDRLPLALEQAAAFMEAHGTAADRYLTLFRDRRADLLAEGDPTAYDGRVDTTWSLNLEQVEAASPAAGELLRLCAHLSPDAIPLWLVRAAPDALSDALAHACRDELAMERAIGALRRYSLVARDHDALRLHRLVQAVTRHRLPPTERPAWLNRTAQLLWEALPEDVEHPLSWPRMAELLPHVQVLADLVDPDGGNERAAIAALLTTAGIYLRLRAELPAALAAQQHALAVNEEVYGPDHPEVAFTLGNLGIVYRLLGDLPAALAAQRRVLAIKEEVYGPDHPEVAITIGNLGVVHQTLGELPAALAAQRRALAIKQEVYGPDHPEVARTLGNLGMVHWSLGDLPAAVAALQRVMIIMEEVYGPDHHEVARTLSNLGPIYQGLGDLPAALAALQRALAIDEEVYGSRHPEVATTLGNLGLVHRDLGDLPAALAAQQRALAIREEVYGLDHPDVARTLGKLGGLYQDLGDLPAARRALSRAVEIFLRTRGADHGDTRWVRGLLDELPD